MGVVFCSPVTPPRGEKLGRLNMSDTLWAVKAVTSMGIFENSLYGLSTRVGLCEREE